MRCTHRGKWKHLCRDKDVAWRHWFWCRGCGALKVFHFGTKKQWYLHPKEKKDDRIQLPGSVSVV